MHAIVNSGVAAWGDLRELDRQIVEDNVGMCAIHALRFAKLVKAAPHRGGAPGRWVVGVGGFPEERAERGRRGGRVER